MTEFPWLRGVNPAMREEHARLQTFTNQEFRRQTTLQASNEILAQAGFYYFGDRDGVKCWCCDGGLQDFLPGDDPWAEHAKYNPQCEYLLQQRGPEWVSAISEQNLTVEDSSFPSVESRIIPQVISSPTSLPPPPPRLVGVNRLEKCRHPLLEEGMQSEPAQRAREIGYSEDRIRDAQWKKFLSDYCCYQSAESLINALIPENRPDSSPGSSASSPQPSVIKIADPNIYFHRNVFGPSLIEQQCFPSSAINIDYSSSTHPTPGTELYADKQPMDKFMTNAFDHPLFRGEMNHSMHGITAISNVNGARAPVIHHHTPKPRGPISSPRPAAPLPRLPLQAITIPRRGAPKTASTATTASTSTTSTNTNTF